MIRSKDLSDTLRSEIGRFDVDIPISAATPPPASWYTDSEFHELEKASTFSSHWLFVGRIDQLARPGQYFTGSIHKRPYLVTRDQAGELRAFYNVCAHHGTRVADGCGEVEHFTCPYHGWEYDLGGGLKRAPLAGKVDQFKSGKVGLQPIPLSTWGPFILLHFGERAQDPVEQFAALSKESELMDMDALRFVTRRVFALDCNWKVFVDNYLDGGYHVPHMHAELNANLEFAEYETRLGDIYSMQSCPAKGSQRLGDLGRFLWIHPNFMINRYGPWMDTNLVLPVNEKSCLVIFDYFHVGGLAAEDETAALAESARVQAEDTEIVLRVQEGLESGVYSGLYASRLETSMHQFHRMLASDFRAFVEE